MSEHQGTLSSEPIGVVLAGGSGQRIGGSKALVQLRGTPLIRYPLTALKAALRDVVVIAKPDTELPSLPGVMVWIETAGARHPLVGIVEALGLAAGRPVLVCAVDLPFVTPGLISAIARTDPGVGAAVLASYRGQTQPLLGCYQPRAGLLLTRLGPYERLSMRDAVGVLTPRLLEVDDPELLFNVNGPEDLLTASALLGGYPKVKE